MSKVHQYAAIAKVVENDDGTVTVEGIASDGSVDMAGETVTPEAMKAAIPGYMALGTGALREMHQPLAAGTVTKADVNDEGQTIISARVVDPIAVLKVKEGVYKGFSIGGSSTGRNGKTITGLRLTEISLVDAPCNPNAVIQVWKADHIEDTMKPEQAVDELAKLVDSGAISPVELLALAKAAKPATDTDAPKLEGFEGQGAETAKQPADTQTSVTTEKVADGAPAQAPAQSETVIKKGMYTVRTLAATLQDLGYMVQDTQSEADFEGDNSPVPGKLREWLKAGVAIFNDMAAEESAELIATFAKGRPVTDVAKVETVAKAVVADPEQPEALTKALGAVADLQAVTKALQESNAALTAQHADLLQKFNALPVPPKGVVTPIEKSAETSAALGGGDQSINQVNPVKKSDGTVDEAATLMKSVYRAGGTALHS